MRVKAYRNLNIGCISLQAVSGEFKGKVIAHVHSVHLLRCKMIVHESSRQSVIKKQQKNVHAWVEGDLECADLIALRYPVQGFPSFDFGMKSTLIKQNKKSVSITKNTPLPPRLPRPDLVHPIFQELHDQHVLYNPYLRGEFFINGTNFPVWSCPSAVVKEDGVWSSQVSESSAKNWSLLLNEALRPKEQLELLCCE